MKCATCTSVESARTHTLIRDRPVAFFNKVDESTGKRLIDEILDVGKQNGTGMWTSQSAMELQVPIPTIDLAVAMRDMSVLESSARRPARSSNGRFPPFTGDRKVFLDQLGHALYAANDRRLRARHGCPGGSIGQVRATPWISRPWRESGGAAASSAPSCCEDIRTAYRNQPGLPNLLLAPELSNKVRANQEDLRHVVCAAVRDGFAPHPVS